MGMNGLERIAQQRQAGFGLAASLAVGVLSFWRLLNPTPLLFAQSAIYAGAGAVSARGH